MSERIQHRGKPITVTIDGKVCNGVYGQTILEIARENDIYIPTMCYLTKVSPIGACRMCSVEVEGVDGFILSCQEKAVDGAKVTTNSQELFTHRQNLVKLYDVNHPLQCGVCDKSGECDLQNKTLEFSVASQEFAAIDQPRKQKKWGILGYDPSLCIMCEKCVHTCNEVIGTAALYIKPGGYKSTIDIKMSRCEQCGDCISVCPVGAMVSNEFKYTANAWEAKKIPATCAHCSSGCSLYYNVKHSGSHDPFGKRITRVTNDFEFSALCGAGRFGFEFENRSEPETAESFEKVVKKFKEANGIRFNSYITNEEALILQKLKENLGLKLLNEDALSYQKFLNEYSKISGNSLYTATSKDIKQSDAIIMIGTRISRDNPGIKYAVNIASKKNRAQFIYMHPIDDIALANKYTQFVKYEVGSEEGVVAMLASYLIDNISEPYKAFFDDLDIGYLSGESSVGEEEFEDIVKKLYRKQKKTLIVGEDIYRHPRALNIARLIGLIDRFSDIDIHLLPPSTNSLGVALICDLDENCEGDIIGYNEFGDFILSDNGKGDFNIPALNQQEGTFTNLDRRVLNTNVALEFKGYCLNDIANRLLDLKDFQYTIDYTPYLPQNKGYRAVKFDDMDNGYNKYGADLRGYCIPNEKIQAVDIALEEIEEIETFNGTVIYRCEPLHQFNKNTAKSLKLQTNRSLRGSDAFAMAAKIKDGDTIKIIYGDQEVIKTFKKDSTIKGTVALYPTFDNELIEDIIDSGYRFKQVQIQKVANNG